MSKRPPNGTFLEVPSAALISELNLIGEAVVAAGGAYFALSNKGHEFAFVLQPPRSRAQVRIYTSVARGATVARARGKDAIRIFWGFEPSEGRFKPLSATTRVFRTAPRLPTPQGRLEAFLKRFRDTIRTVYKAALRSPRCALCQAPMVRREGRNGPFWGCAAYPACTRTAAIATTIDVSLPMASETGRSVDVDKPEGTRRNMPRTFDVYGFETTLPGHAVIAQYGMPNGEMAQAQIEGGLAAELDNATFFDLPLPKFEGSSKFAALIIAGDRERRRRR